MTERDITNVSKSAGYVIDCGIMAIQDVDGLGWKHMYTPALDVIKNTVEIDKEHYPEILRKLLIVNCPTIFTLFWKIFSPLLDPATVVKTELLKNSGLAVIEKTVRPERIPTYLGGKCTEHSGNCVPGGGPFSAEGVNVDSHNSSMIEVTVKARSQLEIPVKVEEASSLICWEFKVAANDIVFKILRQKSEKEFEEAFPKIEHKAGEPHQGQIVAKEVGTYLLCFDNQTSILRSKTIQYHLELLPPDSVKGFKKDEVKPEQTKKNKKEKKKSKKKRDSKSSNSGSSGKDDLVEELVSSHVNLV